MSEQHFLGIDPGKSGGAAIIQSDGLCIEAIGFTNMSDHDINEFFAKWSTRLARRGNNGPAIKAVLERVKGRGGWSATANFSFGESSGLLRGLLAAHRINYDREVPTIWQGRLGMRKKKGEESRAFKRRLKARAQQIFPYVVVTDTKADALLIAEFARVRGIGES